MPKKGNEHKPEFPSRENRLERILAQFQKGARLYLKKNQQPNLTLIGHQIASQFNAHYKNKPKPSEEEKKALISSIASQRISSISPILRNLTNRKKYEAKIASAVLAMATKDINEVMRIQKEIVKSLDVEEEYVSNWIQTAFRVYYDALAQIK